MALAAFQQQLVGQNILVRTDNMSSKWYQIKDVVFGSQTSTWAEKHLAGLRAESLKGLENRQADWLSRKDLDPGGV